MSQLNETTVDAVASSNSMGYNVTFLSGDILKLHLFTFSTRLLWLNNLDPTDLFSALFLKQKTEMIRFIKTCLRTKQSI